MRTDMAVEGGTLADVLANKVCEFVLHVQANDVSGFPQTLDRWMPCSCPVDAASTALVPTPVAPLTCSAPAPSPFFCTTNAWNHRRVSVASCARFGLAPSHRPHVADYLCGADRVQPLRILQISASSERS